LGTKLILVLGHTGCGAVRAATEASRGAPPESANLRAITDRILEGIGEDFDPAAAVEANVRATMRALTRDSAVLAEAVEQGVEIAGAVYDLASGRVRLL
ncbi:MAG: carbonic anhydrase, partial [Deltaproteobacteria bacterium]